jgi:spermidine synthase
MKVRTSGGPLTVDLTLTPLERVHSPYQELIVGKAEEFGRLLILDGEVQFAESDEFIYHEMLAYPPALLSKANRALILGGGDGLLAHRLLGLGIDTTIVDLDEEVIKLSKKYFYDMGSSSLDKAHVIIGDALKYESDEPYDVIYVDLPDYVDVPFLYDEKAFNHYKSLLKEGGFLAVHVDYYKLPELLDKIRGFFEYAFSYAAFVPSFFSLWTFTILSDKPFDPKELNKLDLRGKYYSPEVVWKYRAGLVPATTTNEKSEVLD